jgi:hypothetical protein
MNPLDSFKKAFFLLCQKVDELHRLKVFLASNSFTKHRFVNNLKKLSLVEIQAKKNPENKH